MQQYQYHLEAQAFRLDNAVVIWDCDGVLVDSEKHAFPASTAVTNAAFRSKGSSCQFHADDLQLRFAGQPITNYITILAGENGIKFTAEELMQIEEDEQSAVTELLRREVQMTEGVDKVLAQLRKSGAKMAVASGSALSRVEVSLTASGLAQYFEPQHIFSAKSLHPHRPKPHPAVYLHALRHILAADPAPGHRRGALAAEDSVSGVRSASSAGLGVIGYIGAYPKYILENTEWRTKAIRALIEAGAHTVITHWVDFFKVSFDACGPIPTIA